MPIPMLRLREFRGVAGQFGGSKWSCKNEGSKIAHHGFSSEIVFLIGMSEIFKRGDHVTWNSETGGVRGVVIKKVFNDREFDEI